MNGQSVVAVNLVNQHGSEGVLANAFQEEYKRFAAARQELRLIPFDFHKICGATRYDKYVLGLARLIWEDKAPHKKLFKGLVPFCLLHKCSGSGIRNRSTGGY